MRRPYLSLLQKELQNGTLGADSLKSCPGDSFTGTVLKVSNFQHQAFYRTVIPITPSEA
jgi:hypothetical protein